MLAPPSSSTSCSPRKSPRARQSPRAIVLGLDVDLHPALYEQIGVLAVAPALAYAAGMLVEGSRGVLAAGMVITLRGARVAISVAIFGLAAITIRWRSSCW